MTKYTITEKQNTQSFRKPTCIREFKSLTAAKACASKLQAFHFTVMTITHDDKLLAYKENGKWHDVIMDFDKSTW